MALFKPRQTKTTAGDPFLDHVITYTSDDGVSYVGAKALTNSDVFTAIKIIASDIATSPIQAYENDEVKDDNLNDLLNIRPNAHTNGWHFKFSLAVNMLLNGNSYAEIKRTPAGEVESFELLRNSDVTMLQRTSGKVYYKIKRENSARTLERDDILHFKFFTQDGLTGVSPLSALKDELNVQKAGNKTIFNFFSRGVNGSGILKVNKSDLNVEAKKAIREKFEEANGSADGDNALRTIILDEEMDYKTLEVNTDVLKLINSNDWTTKQVAKAFGLPVERLGVENAHSSITQSNLRYLQDTLVHYFNCFASELKNKLQTDLRFNADRLNEADPEAKSQTIATQVRNGLITINEGRAELGYKPVENGDRLLASLNNTFLDTLSDYQFKKEGVDPIDDTNRDS